MTSSGDAYGPLIAVDPEGGGAAEELTRVPVEVSVAEGGVVEATLQDMLFRFPQALPIRDIDPAYAGAIPVCRELRTAAGQLDALYVNGQGRLTLAEFKLWRNPGARREVIGQILDYAKELASWSYDDLRRGVSLRTGKELYDLVRERHSEVGEAAFVDSVARHLKRGEFLMLIVGDGIREGVEKIVDFVQGHGGLHFNLALVEAALWRDGARRWIVQPRVLARTEIVKRDVVEGGAFRDDGPRDDGEEPLSDHEEENLRFWKAVTEGLKFSDDTVDPPAAAKWPTLSVKVANSGFGGWGLWFNGSIDRTTTKPGVECYLSCRKGIELAERIYDELSGSDEVREELGDGIETWDGKNGRPRLGFRRPGGIGDEEFDEAVAWMREHLDLLVSTLNPRIQRMIRDED